MKTPEHFEKKPPAMSQSILCRECMQDEDFQYQVGYNEALEKTNAKELYEALLFAKSHIEKCCVMTDGNIVINRINQTIEKANKL